MTGKLYDVCNDAFPTIDNKLDTMDDTGRTESQ